MLDERGRNQLSWVWKQMKPNREKTLEELQREYYETGIAANRAIIEQIEDEEYESFKSRRSQQSEKYRVLGQLHDINQSEINHWMNTTGNPSWELTLGNDKYHI